MTTRPLAEASHNEIRGQGIRSFMDVLDEVGGAGTREALLSVLRSDVADAYRYGAVIASGWYPLEWYCDMHRAVRQLATLVPDIHRRIGYASTSRDIRGVYRFMLAMASPAFAFTQAGRILSTYMRSCRAAIGETRPEGGVVRLTIPGASDELWSDVAGAIEAIVTACGGCDPAVAYRTERDVTHALFECMWVTDGSMRRLA